MNIKISKNRILLITYFVICLSFFYDASRVSKSQEKIHTSLPLLETINELQIQIETNDIVVVLFTDLRTKCGSCRIINPQFERSSLYFKEEKGVAFFTVDAIQSRSLAQKYNLPSFRLNPVIKIFVGKEIFDYIGSTREDFIINRVKRILYPVKRIVEYNDDNIKQNSFYAYFNDQREKPEWYKEYETIARRLSFKEFDFFSIQNDKESPLHHHHQIIEEKVEVKTVFSPESYVIWIPSKGNLKDWAYRRAFKLVGSMPEDIVRVQSLGHPIILISLRSLVKDKEEREIKEEEKEEEEEEEEEGEEEREIKEEIVEGVLEMNEEREQNNMHLLDIIDSIAEEMYGKVSFLTYNADDSNYSVKKQVQRLFQLDIKDIVNRQTTIAATWQGRVWHFDEKYKILKKDILKVWIEGIINDVLNIKDIEQQRQKAQEERQRGKYKRVRDRKRKRIKEEL